jgi:hypothetical protein
MAFFKNLFWHEACSGTCRHQEDFVIALTPRSPARKLLVNLAAMLALAGCAAESSTGDNNGNGNGNDPEDRDPSSIDIRRGSVLASLMRADSCDDLLGRIQDDVAAKIELQAEQLKRGEQYGSPGGGTGGLNGGFDNSGNPPPVSGGPGVGGTGGAGGSAGTGAAPMTPDGEGNAGNGGSGGTGGSGAPVDLGPSDYSDTNTQVEGVDEADIVKTDGDHIYLVHGNELFVLKSWPASESSIESSIEIEGSVTEMFVHQGKAAVFSYVYDQGDLIEPRPSTDGASDAAFYPGYYYGTPFTKITLIDLAQAQPIVERELIIEGTYLSSRRHGSKVRAVLQGGFHAPPVYYAQIEYVDPWGREYAQEDIDAQVDAWRDRVIAGVRMTTIEDWLPAEREVIDGVLTPPERRCTDFYAPPPGLTSYGLTNVVAFDILDPTASLGGAFVLGSADEVYSNSDVLLLAQRDYRWDARLAERSRTILHLFNLSEDATDYAASGFAPGHILDQFSLDEQDGFVRLTTTTQAWNEWSSEIVMPAQDDPWVDIAEQRSTDNRVITLGIEDGELVRAGVSESLGEDGETIFSTRFVGDRAYVVTFRQTDPLMVVDLSDVADPTLLGELHIPGFSDYMHPIGDGHLLTIGRDADVNGTTRGLLLQLFDVTDPTHPVQTHRHAYTQDGWSEANSNHKAFTFFQPGEGSPYEGLLAFPFVNYSGAFQSTLEVFDVSLEGGFSKLGSVDHTALVMSCYVEQNGGVLPGDYYDPYYCGAPEVRRGMFVTGNEDDEYVYSISHGGMLVHQLPELTTPVASVSLPQADYSEHRVSYGGGSEPVPGTGGSAGAVPGDSGGGEAGSGVAGTGGSTAGVGGSAGTGASGVGGTSGTGAGAIGGTGGAGGVGGASGDGS